jgi:hypothetical protein
MVEFGGGDGGGGRVILMLVVMIAKEGRAGLIWCSSRSWGGGKFWLDFEHISRS